ncbi:glycopeptide antibiotics resistance protein [Stackebrandtia albiflava]|uniref:Glycopeptide antibiotics resistance protein n=1 Tax=Stackebrandtia albiflava TaxID=406432 RepID=A0A562V4K1_9ACTN|nr:VanZ family protein [Stackebrandtia albiflava]TWJ12821.1 glycopeptide antibiotics resistance protein [Stackebrandtia albiflava]
MDHAGEWQVVWQGLRQVTSEPSVRLVLLIGLLLSVPLGWWLATVAGWRRIPTVLTLVWTTVILALTLPVSTGGTFSAEAVRSGAGFLWHLPGQDNLTFWEYTLGTAYGVANIALYVPFGLFAALATRRYVWSLLAGVVLTVGVETTQAMFGRIAESDDVINNTLGVLLGVAAALLIGGLLRLGRGRPAGRGTTSRHSADGGRSIDQV